MFFLAATGQLHAAIISSTNCSAGDGHSGVSQSGATSCTVTYNDPTPGQGTPTASASTAASYTGPIIGSPSSSVSLQLSDTGSASAFATFPTTYAAGSANEVATFTFETLGPVSSGQIIFSAAANIVNGGDPPFPNTVSFSIGGINSTCVHGAALSPANCSGTIGGSNGLPATPQTQPFTLGQSFTLQESAAITANGSYSSGGDGTGSIAFSFHLLDANGNPVQIYDITAPEPATFLLAGLPLCLLAVVSRRRSKSIALP